MSERIGRFQIDTTDTRCFCFYGHFYKAYKEEVNVRGGTLIENYKKRDGISFCL